jgi:hypothetical protein
MYPEAVARMRMEMPVKVPSVGHFRLEVSLLWGLEGEPLWPGLSPRLAPADWAQK